MSPRPNAEAEPSATQVATQVQEMPHNVAEESLAHWADPTADGEDILESVSTYDMVKKLIVEAKKFKSLTSLVHLYAVKSFVELCAKYFDSPWIKNPIMLASHTVTASIGKGPYFARKI